MNEADDLILNKKNYTLWRLRMTDQLQKRQWFSFTANEDRSRERPSFGYYNRSMLRERKEECLQYLFSKVNLEIYEEIKHLDQASRVWSYLQSKYCRNGMKRLNASMKELQTMRFNLERFDLFTEKFRKAARKVEDCGLQLDDNYLNLYFLASLQRCNRIENAGEFYNSIDCKFDEFLAKIKDRIINPPDIEYSDISDDSMLSFDEEDQSPSASNGINGSLNQLNKLPSLSELSARVDKNLQRFGATTGDCNEHYEKSELNRSESDRRDCENDDDSKSDYRDACDKLDEFDRLVDECDQEKRQANKRAEAFPSSLSPIKIPSQAIKVAADEMETDENDDQSSKVYEDLNAASHVAVLNSNGPPCEANAERLKEELDTAISSITNETVQPMEDNHQLTDDQQTAENVNQPEDGVESGYFFYDRSGSH